MRRDRPGKQWSISEGRGWGSPTVTHLTLHLSGFAPEEPLKVIQGRLSPRLSITISLDCTINRDHSYMATSWGRSDLWLRDIFVLGVHNAETNTTYFIFGAVMDETKMILCAIYVIYMGCVGSVWSGLGLLELLHPPSSIRFTQLLCQEEFLPVWGIVPFRPECLPQARRDPERLIKDESWTWHQQPTGLNVCYAPTFGHLLNVGFPNNLSALQSIS